MRRPPRLIYAAGPSDLVAAFRRWKAGTDAPFEMSIAVSSTFLDWCESATAQVHMISSNDKRQVVQEGRYIVENRPRHGWYRARGVRHHLALIEYGLSIVGTAMRERPDLIVVDSGTTHWMVLTILALARIPVIAVMHSTLWPAGFEPARTGDRLLRLLDGLFFRHLAAGTLCVSPECERQVRLLARDPKGFVVQCRYQFRRRFFNSVIPPPAYAARPFRVVFVGRIKEFKGVFLILSIAEMLEREMPGGFIWRIFGYGDASAELARQVEQRKLAHLIELPGMLSRERVQEAYGWAHAVVVPTTSQFNEGLAMTAVEAALSGRPVVLSTVVPAWEVLGGAAIRAQADDVESFADAFLRLALDSDY
jgi:glycogen(starch) synthase